MPTDELAPQAPMPIVFKVVDWPEAHRTLWETGTAPRAGRLAPRKHADTLRPHSIRNAGRAWGAFLAVLAATGVTINVDPPAALVTQDNVAHFVDSLVARGNKQSSIRTRLFELRVATRILAPAADLDWLTRPADVSINDWFEGEPEPKEPLDPRKLTRLGLDLIASAVAAPEHDDHALRQYRNGLICLLLAALPIRIGSLALMRVGVHLIDRGSEIWVHFAAHETKNHRPIETALPDHLLGPARHYLAQTRPRMLAGSLSDWLWLNVDGTRFGHRGIEGMFRRLTTRAFGEARGTHRSRHGMASTLADLAPERPGLAAAVLGVGEQVVDRHYRLAEQRHAARIATALLEAERDELRLRAQSAFGHRK